MSRKKTDRLAACRQFYAKMVAAGGGQLREDLERAFEIVPREYFLGAGPWLAMSSVSGMFVATPTDDPIHVIRMCCLPWIAKSKSTTGSRSCTDNY